MNIDDMYPPSEGRYLAAADLQDGKDYPLIIDRVEKAVFDKEVDGQVVQTYKPAVYFRGARKAWTLGWEVKETIKSMFGPDVRNWVGKELVLFKTTTRFQGKLVPCIRVKQFYQPLPSSNGGAHQTPASAGPPPGHPANLDDLDDAVPF